MNATAYSRGSGRGEVAGFGDTSSSGMFSMNSNPASLKGKIQQLEEISVQVNHELQLQKKELSIMNTEKDSLSQVLNMKA